MADEQDPPLMRRAIKLDKSQRWIIGTLGLAGMGAGSVAVFTKTVEAGPVAMVGLGALFFLIGFSGVLPTRLKIGDNEAEWLEEVGEQLALVADLVPPESRPDLAEALERLSVLTPRAASPAIAGMAYEELVAGMLIESLGSVNHGRTPAQQFVLERDIGAYGLGFDAVIKQGTHIALGVEIKAYSQPLPPTVARRLISQAYALQSQTHARRLLLVTRTRLTTSAKRAMEDAKEAVDYVEVADRDDLDKLTQALRRSLIIN